MVRFDGRTAREHAYRLSLHAKWGRGDPRIRNAMRVWEGEGTMLDLCLADADLVRTLGEKGIRACFDLKRLLRHADTPFRRALRS